MKADIRDIAEMAGVSIATVSRAFSNSSVVSEKTLRKVLDAADKLNYVPSQNARYLKKSQSDNVAVLVRGMDNPLFAGMIHTIERRLIEKGYSMIVQSVEEHQNEMHVAANLHHERKLCGAIFLGGLYSDNAEDFARLEGLPCVFITFEPGEDVDRSAYSSVLVDDEGEVCRAAELLIGQGHRHFCFLAKDVLTGDTTGSRRLRGVRLAMQEHGIQESQLSVIDSEYTIADGYRQMMRYYPEHRETTAVICGSDTIAIGVTKALLTQRVRVPQDVSVIGFDGIDAASYYHPAIGSIVQPAKEMAGTGIDLLFRMLDGEGSGHVVCSCSFECRDTVGSGSHAEKGALV